jgi:hypothetical protein
VTGISGQAQSSATTPNAGLSTIADTMMLHEIANPQTPIANPPHPVFPATSAPTHSSSGSSPSPSATNPGIPPRPGTRSPSADHLTDEQADFITRLYDLNVPAPAIASVIERMIRREGRTGEGAGASASGREPEGGPPHYDFKNL